MAIPVNVMRVGRRLRVLRRQLSTVQHAVNLDFLPSVALPASCHCVPRGILDCFYRTLDCCSTWRRLNLWCTARMCAVLLVLVVQQKCTHASTVPLPALLAGGTAHARAGPLSWLSVL